VAVAGSVNFVFEAGGGLKPLGLAGSFSEGGRS
jgi:hypothetical protein